MIIAERKPLQEIYEMVREYKEIVVLGCGTCVTVCFAGGEKEVRILSSALRMMARKDGKELKTTELTIKRQCENEYIDEVKDEIERSEAVLSLGCGIGVQTIAELFEDKVVLPALNTSFLGMPEEQGVWTEKCKACGDCILHLTAGICPIARCSKSVLNGPCGGTTADGKCEVNKEIDCAWYLIYKRLSKAGKEHLLEEIYPVRDWRASGHGGPRKIVREDLMEVHL